MAMNLQSISYPVFPKGEQAMQTIYPRYTLAERLVLAIIGIVTWPVERILGHIRRKVVADMAPSSNRR